jgi:predicted permease
MLRRLHTRIHALRNWRRKEADLDDEIGFHLSEEAEERAAAGLTPQQARYAAHKDFGNVTLIRETTREVWGWGSAERLIQDLRYAVRTLRKAPGFAAAATLTLALGLGVNISLFTVLNATLLERLPVREPDRLVQVYTWSREGGDHNDFSYPLYVDLRDNTRAFDGLMAVASSAVGVSASGQNDRVVAEFVTANYFSVLDADLVAGPGFAGRDELRGSEPTAVISDRLWQNLFGRSASAIGRTMLVNGHTYTVVGVAPPQFDGLTRGQRADIWMTVAQFGPVRGTADTLMGRRETSWLSIFGRLAPGVTPEQAAAEVTTFGSGLAVINAGPGFTARTRSAASGDTGLVESLDRPLRLLMLGVGLILIVAAANVANLLLARSHARQAEIALRHALGASRGRIVRQLLTEGAVLAFAGGTIGLVLAFWIVGRFEIRTAAGTLLTLRLEPNGAVIAFAAALSVFAGIVAALIPALSASRPDLLRIIKGSPDPARGRFPRHHVRAGLVVIQIAVSLVLVVGAGLFFRSLGQLRSIDPTLADDRVVASTINLSLLGYDEPRGRQFYSSVLERVGAMPGVESASLAYVLPVTQGGIRMDVGPRTTTPPVDGPAAVELIPVSSGFFRTVAVPLVAGRDFDDGDGATSRKVVVINETMRQRFWPDGNAIGQPFTIADETYEVVGVARDTKYRSLREAAKMTMYMPYTQSHQSSANLLVRTALPADRIVEGLRDVVRALDSGMPLYNVRTLAQHVDRSLYVDRVRAALIGWLAALALALAAIGIYGVVSFTVSERTREVGIHLALGAKPSAVLRMVLGCGLRLGVIGVGAGLVLSLWLTRLVARDLFGVTPTDPVTIAGASAVLLSVVLLATFIPSRRATRIDPLAAIRTE